jgi:hypothetical protein
VIFIRGGLSDAEIEEESGMSKQAAHKLAHGALNVVWEKLETLDFLGVDTQFPKSRWASQGRKSNGLTSIRPAIHLKLFTFHDIKFQIIFQRGGSQNRIGQAHFSLLAECDSLVGA